MQNLRKELCDLVKEAKALHLSERQITLESVGLVGEFECRRAALNMGVSTEDFAKHIGLTPNQYWKRAQAARVMRFFPRTRDMVLSGETQVSLLAVIASKITPKNAEILLNGIKNKTKREVEGLLSKVTLDGRVLDQEAEVEIRLKLTEAQLKILDRAREVLAHGGHVPSAQEILVKALGDLLEKRDPIRKAERVMAKKAKALPNPPSLGKELRTAQSPSRLRGDMRTNRSAIPAHIKHPVRIRDGSQCTWLFKDGTRCSERMMLEMDHIDMWCRGGEHSVENLTLRCRQHNQFSAELQLGATHPLPWGRS